MNSLLTKLVLSGMAIDRKISFDLQEILLPSKESRTYIIYDWQISTQAIENYNSADLLCVVQDKGGQRIHFVRDLIYDYSVNYNTDPIQTDTISKPERTNQKLMFVTDNDTLFSWGSFRGGSNTYADLGIINEGFVSPLGLNDNANVARRSEFNTLLSRSYDYKPELQYSDKDGFDNQGAIAPILTNDPTTFHKPFYKHVVSFLEVNMSIKELQKWILQHG